MNLYRDCFVCSIKTDEWRSGLSGLLSQHSNTRITVLIRTILGAFQSARNVDDELNCICPDCLSRLEDCDWQRQTTQRCERELYELLVSTEIQSLAKQKADELEESQAQATARSGVLDVGHFHDSPPQAQQSSVDGIRAIRGRRTKVSKHAKVKKVEPAEDVSEGVRIKSGSELTSDSDGGDDPNFDCSIEQWSSESESADEDVAVKPPRKVATRRRSRRPTKKSADPKETKAEPAENAPSDSDEQPMRPKRSFKCSQCDEVYRTQQMLKVHMKWHRREANKLRCSKCYYFCADQEQFDEHAKLHETVDELQCVFCKGKPLRDRAGLRLHMRTHMDIRNFQCDICGKQFNHAGTLRIHTRYHLNIRPIKCPQCPMSFVEKPHLTRHMRTHTLEKPFACPICDRRFANKYNMRSHERRHTADANAAHKFECSFCSSSFRTQPLLTAHLQKSHEISTPHHEIPNKLVEMEKT